MENWDYSKPAKVTFPPGQRFSKLPEGGKGKGGPQSGRSLVSYPAQTAFRTRKVEQKWNREDLFRLKSGAFNEVKNCLNT